MDEEQEEKLHEEYRRLLRVCLESMPIASRRTAIPQSTVNIVLSSAMVEAAIIAQLSSLVEARSGELPRGKELASLARKLGVPGIAETLSDCIWGELNRRIEGKS